MTIAEKIYKLRTDLHLSQKEFAEKIGTSQSAVNYWENGKRQPRIEQLQKIAQASQLNMNSLLENDLEDSPIYQAFQRMNKTDSDLFYDYKNNYLATGINCEIIDIEMIKKFKQLNELGQTKAIEQIELLIKIPEYQSSTFKAPTN